MDGAPDLARDGYVVLDPFLTGDTFASVRAAVLAHVAAETGTGVATARGTQTGGTAAGGTAAGEAAAGGAAATGTLHVDMTPLAETALAPYVADPRLLAAVNAVLGPAFRRTGLHYRGPAPGYGAQTLHADWTHPAPDGDFRVCTAILALVDFTEAAGPTRLVPGSHLDWSAFRAKDPSSRHPAERPVLVAAGACVVFNGHVLHSGTRNRSAGTRHSVIANFTRD